MNIWPSSNRADYEITVKTGDVKRAGTDSNVFCALIDEDGNKSRDIKLDYKWRNNFEQGNVDIFEIQNVPDLKGIQRIELWREKDGIFGVFDDWFLEYIIVKKMKCLESGFKDVFFSGLSMDTEDKFQETAPFPCNRWIQPERRYTFIKYDSILPQLDDRVEQRKCELEEKRLDYVFDEKVKGLPKQVQHCPQQEVFSNEYKWKIFESKVALKAQKMFTKLTTSGNWDDLDDILGIYKYSFEIPQGYYDWRSDRSFGIQRVGSCNPTLIQLCKEIPSNFAVTNEMVEQLLGGLKLEEAIHRKEIYIVDHKVLHDFTCKEDRTICAPLALFHAKKNGDLLPIAIQLFQEAGADNPVFLPSDPPFTWMLVKMYFNNADCAIHQACTHLGFTHLLVESICVATHRELSPSHPVYQLMAPHFLYLIAINSLAVKKLLSPGGWIDVTMTTGAEGLLEVVRRKWEQYRLDREGWLPADLKMRGVDDKESLPFYPYRDDGLLLHDAIYGYVEEVLTSVYDTPEKLREDFEIQAWAKCLTSTEGAGLKGVFGDGSFDELEDLAKTITAIIFLSSVGHASANFAQYDEYAFPPNYPAILHGKAPRNKDALQELDVVKRLPSRETTLSIMVVTKILSDRGTNKLGDFEVQYQYSPKAVAAVENFRKRLAEISEEIKERNRHRSVPYPYLDPEDIPNAISI